MHETHRRRLFWNPFNFRDVLKDQEDLKDIKINLDISHWVVCLERIFDSPESHQVGLELLEQRVRVSACPRVLCSLNPAAAAPGGHGIAAVPMAPACPERGEVGNPGGGGSPPAPLAGHSNIDGTIPPTPR